MSAILEVSELCSGYGKKQVVRSVDFAAETSKILLVLGHNGAGKTTLMRSIFGLMKPTGGRVIFEGRDIAGRNPAENVASGIAFIPQGHGIFRTLSVQHNLDLGALRLKDKSRTPDILDKIFSLFPILKARVKQTAGTLSGGQQQMLAIGIALMHEPRLIILDEPSIGLAPALVDRVMASIAEINRAFGATIVMVEQNLHYSLRMADKVIILNSGRKVYDGDADPLHDRLELLKWF